MGQHHARANVSGGAGAAASTVSNLGKLEERLGTIQVTGRYHKQPKCIEQDYVLEEKVLGTGYNGDVVLACRKGKPDGEKFAVKTFKLANVRHTKMAQLESEVEIFLSMDHPHITRLYDVYEGDDHLHLVMECMEGGELFDRVKECKRFSELDAADSVWQMLLPLNYIHQHGMVHRDLKLENFLYDKPGSSHLKLIDFGFSKHWQEDSLKMHISCGTLSYVAPEVIMKSYGNQCDLWSLGVITFILLAGYMPFSGPQQAQTKRILDGTYEMKPLKWDPISEQGKDFVKSLLQVNPEKRLSAQTALEHPWIARRTLKKSNAPVDAEIASALRDFGHSSKFRRCCMEMMAWHLSNDERAQVRDQFIKMDVNQHGTVTLGELKKVLCDNFVIDDAEVKRIFNAMDTNKDEEIHYSDFLAAMVSKRIDVHEELLLSTFKKFDVDSSGYITAENLKEVIGESFDGEEVEKLLAEGDLLKDNRISYEEFVAYLKGQPLDAHCHAANKVIDTQLAKTSTPPSSKLGVRKKSNSFILQDGGGDTKSKQPLKSPNCCIIV